MKLGMHVSVRESGARGVLVGLDGETASVRLRGTDKVLATEATEFAVSALKGEKGRPMILDRLPGAIAVSAEETLAVEAESTSAPETTEASTSLLSA